MKYRLAVSLAIIAAVLMTRGVSAQQLPRQTASEAEAPAAAAWFAALGGAEEPQDAQGTKPLLKPPALPFSFVCGSERSADLLRRSASKVSRRTLDGNRTEQVITWNDAKTGLEIRTEAVLFGDFPAVQGVVFFKNRGTADTPVLADVLPLDVRIPLPDASGRNAMLRYAKGALCCIDDFAPVEKALAPGSDVRLEPGGGRSSSEVLPFFNLDFGGEGVLVGIGWSGQWAAAFGCDRDKGVSARAGMATTHLKLHPGEEICTPRILALFWKGDRMRGNNLLRRFLLTHHRPKPGGNPLVLPVLIGSWGGSPAADHLKTIQRIIRHNLPIELYWIDAEWFGQGAPWFKHNGNWEVRKDLYPQGFRALSDPLHVSGRKLLLWFEPQRVCPGTPWARFKDRPNWFLELKNGEPVYKQRNCNWGIPHDDPRWIVWESRRSQMVEGDLLWNVGDPAARQFLTDWLSDCIKEFGLDWYREDFNIAPLEYWQNADPPNRRGMTEIRYITGLYAMWDDLLRRHPHLAIDNCASGGRRIDLESIRRATALWRTDWPADAIHKQCHTFGLMSWVPLHMSGGAMLKKGNDYEIRSAMTAGLNGELPPQDEAETMQQSKAIIDQYLGIQRFYYGDYYPLTPYSQAPDAWLAYQLHLPETDEGLVVVFRRPKSTQNRQCLRLFGLDVQKSYEITNLDSSQKQRTQGGALVQQGLEVQLDRQPDSALIRYARKP